MSPAILQRESQAKHALQFAAVTFLLCLLLTPVSGLAQDNSYAMTVGQQAYQMYAENSVESVNVTNGNLNLQIPLLSYKQRGSLPPITLKIVFNADNWTLTQPIGPPPNPNVPANQHQFYQFIGGGAAFSVSPFFEIKNLSESYNFGSNSSNQPTQYTITEPGLVDSSGAVHLLALTSPNDGPRRSVDATGYFIDTEYNSTTGAITHQAWLGPDGVGYRDSIFSDPNGNGITPNLASNTTAVSQGSIGRIASYTDSLGRFLPMPSNYQALDPQPGCQTFQYPGPPGSPQIPLAFCYTNYSVSSPFNNPDVGAYPASHLVAISSVTLPNGTQWKFDYNGYGDLTTLTYPTGATVTYNWVTGGGCSTTGPSRSIQSRTVNTGKRSDTWTYDFSYDSNQVWHGTETDPVGNKIVHGGGPCSPETSTQYIDATAGIVSTTNYIYTFSGNFGAGVGYLNPTNIVRRRATTTLANGLVKQTCFIYDNDRDTTCSGDKQIPGASDLMFYDDEDSQRPAGTNQAPYQPTPFPLVLGKLLYQYESDWGQGSPGPLLRQTTTHYKWQDDAGYLAANLIDIPTSVCVPLPGASACSPSAGDTASYTSYGYDENNGSPQGILGNQTSVTTWTGTGPSLTRNTVFNASGMPTAVTDPGGNTTTMVYDASGLFPKTVTGPSTNGVSHSTAFTYDDPSGVLVSTTNENGGVTSYVYDVMSRATTTMNPVGQTTYAYTDVSSSVPLPSYTSAQSINDSTSLTQQISLDGLGRPVTSTLTSDPSGAMTTDTVYDALGRLFTVSNPHRSGTSLTDGVTTTYYDVLGRTTSISLPDGNSQTWSYTGNITTKTDELGRQRQQFTDGLGQLTELMEPDPTTGKPAYRTDYKYDLLGNLTSAVQSGDSGDVARSRRFTYDGMSRLITSTNPETGTVCYGQLSGTSCSSGYDGNGNLHLKTDARGVVTTYNYDALNRITSKSYTLPTGSSLDPTPSSCFAYDVMPDGTSASNASGRLVAEWTQAGACSSQALSASGGALNWKKIFAYDPMGRITQEQQCAVAPCSTSVGLLNWSYDQAGNVISSTNGAAAANNFGFTYGYDGASRLASITSSWNTDKSHPQTLFLADSATVPSAYGPFGLTNAQLGLPSSSGSPLLARLKEYDNRGRVTHDRYSASAVTALAGQPAGSSHAQVLSITPNPVASGVTAIAVTSCDATCGSGTGQVYVNGSPSVTGFRYNPGDQQQNQLPNSLTSGSYNVYVVFARDSDGATFTSPTVSFTVTNTVLSDPQMTFSLSPNPIPLGESGALEVTLTACGSNCGSGVGRFTIDGNFGGGFEVDGDGDVITYTSTAIAAGTHSLVVYWQGSESYAASTQSGNLVVKDYNLPPGNVTPTVIPSTGVLNGEYGSILIHNDCNSACGSGQYFIDGNFSGGFFLDDSGNDVEPVYPGLATGSHKLTLTYFGDTDYKQTQSNPITFQVIDNTLQVPTIAVSYPSNPVPGDTWSDLVLTLTPPTTPANASCQGQGQIIVDGQYSDSFFIQADNSVIGNNGPNPQLRPLGAGTHNGSVNYFGNDSCKQVSVPFTYQAQ